MADLRLRARSATELVDAAIQLYRRNGLEYLAIAAVVYTPLTIAQIITSASTATGAPGDVPASGASVAVVIGLIISMIGIAIASVAIDRHASDVYLGGAGQLSESLQVGIRRFGAVVLAYVLVVIILMLGIVPAVAIAGVLMAAKGGALMMVIAGILGVVAVVWGIYASIRLYAVVPVVALENVGAIAAVQRSWKLSRHNKGRVVVTYLLLFLIALIVFVGAVSIGAFLANKIVLAVINGLASIIFFPVFALIQTTLYYDARIRDEGFDIEWMARSIDAPASSASPAAM